MTIGEIAARIDQLQKTLDIPDSIMGAACGCWVGAAIRGLPTDIRQKVLTEFVKTLMRDVNGKAETA